MEARTCHQEQLRAISHAAAFVPESRLATLNGTNTGTINSSHHQAIDRPGKNLRVTVQAADGMIEGIEWNGDSNWVVGVSGTPSGWLATRWPRDCSRISWVRRAIIFHATLTEPL